MNKNAIEYLTLSQEEQPNESEKLFASDVHCTAVLRFFGLSPDRKG